MSFTAEHELTLRRAVAGKVGNVPEAGYIIPAPIVFKDKADFWAQINGLAVNTQKLIETTNIAFCCISLLQRVDYPKEGCGDNPLIRLTYNFYFFRGYDDEREDESEMPDDFLKRTLKTYNLFVKTVMDAFTQFLGLQNIPEFPAEELTASTNSMTQPEFIDDFGQCRYIKGAAGHSVSLQSVVEVQIYAED